MAPAHDSAGSTADSDQQLVTRVRRGDDRAFEILYQRYHRRIHAYVLGMVKDHGRTEDVTQEVFVSALRRMRETEQPLAFKPWLYQIAKNSCIDAFRRSKRAEEVSYDAEDALAPSDHSRLVGNGPSPDAAVAAKEDLDNLCGAFGGLSETHHEILVLRELEGLSYQEIGRRMGMTRPAVESTLFRARRRLTEEYDDIVSGARCRRIQGIIVTASRSRLGARDTRRLARHLSHCQPCRREALAAGLDRGLFARPSVRERVASRVAGLLPFPIWFRFRRGAEVATPPGARSATLMQFTEQGWGKAAAGAAVLVAGVGAGVGVPQHQTPAPTPAAVHAAPVAAARTASAPVKPAATRVPTTTTERADASSRRSKPRSSSHKNSAPLRRAKADRGTSSLAAGSATSGADAPAAEPPVRSRAGGTGGNSGKHRGSAGGGASSKTPSAPAPSPTQEAVKQTGQAVQNVTDAVNKTTENVTGAVNETTQKVTSAVNETTQKATAQVDNTVGELTGGGPVAGGVDKATDDVDDTVGAVTGQVDKTVQQTTDTLNGIVGAGG
jgi:RNA polymerase sigma factor (sigma-70 family)